MTDRYDALRQIARGENLDAIALVPGANFSRLFNAQFHQNERPLLVLIPVEGKPSAVVPNLELASFSALGFEGEVFDWRDQTGYQIAFDELMKSGRVRQLGVEGQVMRVFVDQALRSSAPGLVIKDAQRSIASLRVRKNADEIDAIRSAIRVTETALANTIDSVRIGMSEREIENVLVQQLFASGAQDFAFSPIVAASTNSAQPHAHSRKDYPVKNGDALLIDCGARLDGVCADITRTFFIGYYDDHQARVYHTVLAASNAAHEAATPGASAHDVDNAAMGVLESSAFSERIRHKTGHGLGRDIHEDPYIMRDNHEPLQPGMVFTIEPGLYDLSEFGIRIEDDVLVTESGSESLTVFDKKLTVIG